MVLCGTTLQSSEGHAWFAGKPRRWQVRQLQLLQFLVDFGIGAQLWPYCKTARGGLVTVNVGVRTQVSRSGISGVLWPTEGHAVGLQHLARC